MPDIASGRVFVAGHTGLAGSAILRRLTQRGCRNLIAIPHRELDLRDQGAVERFFDYCRPDYVFLAAAKVGGIMAISLMPTNLYGPGDNFDLNSSHVVPALLRRFHEACRDGAPSVTLWGTGTPRREFLHVNDLASAACFAMENYDDMMPLNVGCGSDVTIAELARLVALAAGYSGHIFFDASHPDGTPRKLLDVSRINGLGWKAGIGLEEGIASTYAWYREHVTRSMAA